MYTSVFVLPDQLSAKRDPDLIDRDDQHFVALRVALEGSARELEQELDQLRSMPGKSGQAAMERDSQIHRVTSRLGALSRYGVDLCLGQFLVEGESDPVYVGRLGIKAPSGERLLVDWRSPVAEPFFAATHASPMGLASRRRYRWHRERIVDFWDEVFAWGESVSTAALDDQSAFVASLASTRSGAMRDVLATIQSDQDAIVRSSSRGALVVDGGPGTGKTVVALHRAAYLLYSDPRLGHNRGGLLFIGPHANYLSYIADVLPSLGEEGVQIATLRDLVPQGAGLLAEEGPEVSHAKASTRMLEAVSRAVAWYEEAPTVELPIGSDGVDIVITAADWREAFAAREPESPHNEARDDVWRALVEILLEKYPSEPDVRALLLRDEATVRAFNRGWPLLEATDVVGDLLSVPALLKLCAPWLDSEQRALLQRSDPSAWTLADLPLLDRAANLLGDPLKAQADRRRADALITEKEHMRSVVDALLENGDEESNLTMLSSEDGLVDEGALPAAGVVARLDGPFAHIIVDEAQELTDAEWQMLLQRCPSRSFTIVGDRAQARAGFPESWPERLNRIGLERISMQSLSVNYRTPQEVMMVAEPVIRRVLPDANVPTSVRSGLPVATLTATDVEDAARKAYREWLVEHELGTVCVIAASDRIPYLTGTSDRLSVLPPALVKGLEFDLVILVAPAEFGSGVAGAVDLYVAMTRATQQLVIVQPSA